MAKLTAPLTRALTRPVALALASAMGLVSAGGPADPVSDPIVLSVNANGWSVTTTSNPPTMDPDGPGAKFLYVVRKGFDGSGTASTFIDQVTLTKRIRLAYPNQASFTADQVALSSVVYADDTVVGLPNNSTKQSPKPTMNWVRTDSHLVGDSLTLEVVGFHRNARAGKQLACVEFSVTDGTRTVTQKVSAMAVSGSAYDKCAVIVYRAVIDISTLTDGVDVTARAKGYPLVGVATSVNDSTAGAASARDFGSRTYRRNVAQAASPYLAVVNPATGNDGTGVVSQVEATAAATPFATINGAITGLKAARTVVDGCEVRLAEASHAYALPAAGTYQTGFADLVITRLSTAAKANAIVTLSAATNWRCNKIRFKGVTLNRTATAGQLNTARFVLEDCTYANNSMNAAMGAAAAPIYLIGADITNPVSSLLGPGTNNIINMVRGCAVTGTASTFATEAWLVLGSYFRNVVPSGSSVVRTVSRSIVAFNKFMGITGAGPTLDSAGDCEGYAFVQNILEQTGTVTSANTNWRPSGDNATNNITNLMDYHNTIVGWDTLGRSNYLYNETIGTLRTHELCTCVGTIHTQWNIKADVFAAMNNGATDADQRTGTWSATHGVDNEGNHTLFATNTPSRESHDYPGLNSFIAADKTFTASDPKVVSWKASTAGPTAGAGDGDYHLQAGSPCIGRSKRCVLPFDLDGNARSTTASAAGAYERLAA